MGSITIEASYYQQFDADQSLSAPAIAYGGWQTEEIEIESERTALVVMHAWNYGTPEQYPGSFRAEAHLGQANQICETVFPPLLKAVRRAGLPVFHVVCGGNYYKDLPGYRRAVELAGEPPEPIEQAPSDDSLERLQLFRRDHTFPGKHNLEDCEASFRNTDFHPGTRPEGDEGIAHFDYQLHALCKEAGINHLIYSGFALDACILMAASGMVCLLYTSPSPRDS